MAKKVLVICSGGREHALAWKLARSPHVEKIFIAPGNAGTAEVGENVPIAAAKIQELADFAEQQGIDLTVVGPDDQLAAGMVDVFQARGLRIFGPSQKAARIESSKVFAKRLMESGGIPTASFRAFTDYARALAYVREHGAPIVVKASGLALGKGVYPCRTIAGAEEALREIMIEHTHGPAGNEVVIEHLLNGKEVSIHALSDGRNAILFPSAQDHKPVHDGDRGKNTGGMGTIAPVPWMSSSAIAEISERIVCPILNLLREEGSTFVGCLYPGLMMTEEGPSVLEFNARFGDPETQVYMRLLESDLYELLDACVEGTLAKQVVTWRPGFAACIVLVSRGYPGGYEKGFPIHGIQDAPQFPGVVVFHAGTTLGGEGKVLTSGGRVLGVTSVGKTLRDAVESAYAGVRRISFEGMHYRSDIGAKSLEYRS